MLSPAYIVNVRHNMKQSVSSQLSESQSASVLPQLPVVGLSHTMPVRQYVMPPPPNNILSTISNNNNNSITSYTNGWRIIELDKKYARERKHEKRNDKEKKDKPREIQSGNSPENKGLSDFQRVCISE